MGATAFNRYNLFYRLERHLLLYERGVVYKPQDDTNQPSESEKEKYQFVVLPPLPSRYQDLVIPELWFLSSKSNAKKRSHRKSHGVASFTEIAQVVAKNWKSIDDETMTFVTSVSALLKEYVQEHNIDLSSGNSPTPSSKKGQAKASSSSKGKRKKKGTTITNISTTRPQELVSAEPPHQVSDQSLAYNPALTSFLTRSETPITPIVSNLTNSHTLTADIFSSSSSQPTTTNRSPKSQAMLIPSSSHHSIDDDNIVNTMEQSFLSHVFSNTDARERTVTDDSNHQHGQQQQHHPRTVTDLLGTIMNNNLNSLNSNVTATADGNNHRPYHYHRRASMPGYMPSSMPLSTTSTASSELDQQSSHGNNIGSGGGKHKRPRRASTMCIPPYNMMNVQRGGGDESEAKELDELDITNEEIFQMWRESSGRSPGPLMPAHNRAA